MISEERIRHRLEKEGRDRARISLIQEHNPMDQTIDMKLTTLDRLAAEKEAEADGSSD